MHVARRAPASAPQTPVACVSIPRVVATPPPPTLPPSSALIMPSQPPLPLGVSIRPAAPGDHAAISALAGVIGVPVGLPPLPVWVATVMVDTLVAEDVASAPVASAPAAAASAARAASGGDGDSGTSTPTPPATIVGYIWAQASAANGYIRQLAVAPNRRRCGLGRALFAAVTAAWADAGCTAWHLYVGAANTAATALYQSVGGAPAASLTAVSLPWSAVSGLGVPSAGQAGGRGRGGGAGEVLVTVELPPALDPVAEVAFAPVLPAGRLGSIRRGAVPVLAAVAVPVGDGPEPDAAAATAVAAAAVGRAATAAAAAAATSGRGVGGAPALVLRGLTTYDPALGGTTLFAAAGLGTAGVLLRALAVRASVAVELPGGVVVGVEADERLVGVLLASGGEVVLRAQRWTSAIRPERRASGRS